jgi:hypothetical protein
VAFPLWQDATNEWSAGAHVRGEFFHTHALLPDTRESFPEELWHVRIGTTYRHQFANGWIGGGTVSVGSASDRPFASLHDLLIGGNAFLRVPQGTHNAWFFSLAYAPTSELPVPLPGVAYLAQPSERLLAAIGLPFYLRYRPWDTLTLEGSYMLLRTVHARATYRLVPPVRLFAGFDWENESYRLADRLHDKDRFFSYDKRATAGGQFTINRYMALDLTGGYVFDRFYFEGNTTATATRTASTSAMGRWCHSKVRSGGKGRDIGAYPILKNSIGFGGLNAALVLKRYSPEPAGAYHTP